MTEVRAGSSEVRATATEELLPCPFCGGEASVQTTYAHGVSEAFCLDCGAHTGYPPDGCTEAEAVAAWNTRSDYAVQAANERKAEQAIEATLGCGTCHAANEESDQMELGVDA